MISDYERKRLDEFFDATKLTLACYRHATFSYLALKEGDDFRLFQGRLCLQWKLPGVLPQHYKSPNILAGIWRLDELKLTTKDFIDAVLAGILRTPRGDFHFPPEKNGSHSLYFSATLGSSGNITSEECRQISLDIRGEDMGQTIQYRGLDSEIKASSVPFHSIKDLCEEYSIGSVGRSNINIDIVATAVATIACDSFVSGDKARLIMLLPQGLERERATLGYWVTGMNKKILDRKSISGSTMSWRTDGDTQIGEIECEVSRGAVIDCVASYAGETQHQRKLADPLTSQNPSHVMIQAFDPNLTALRALIFESYGKGKSKEAREFETAIAWLFRMIGFNVTQLGGTSKTSEAPDLVATTPNGHVAVVECTTGLLKEESKLAILWDRSERIKKRLEASGFSHLKMLPIIVTSKTSNEVRIESEPARKQGIFVITRETLESMIERSATLSDPEKLYDQAMESLRYANDPFSLTALVTTQANNQATVW